MKALASVDAAPRSWRAFVPGHAAPKGSIVQAVDPRTGKKFVRESSRRAPGWMKAVNEVAQYNHRPRPGPLRGPVGVKLTFRLPRPKANGHPFPMDKAKGDIDKLARCVLDAIQGPILLDDAEVVTLQIVKLFANPERPAGVSIVAWEIPEEQWEALGA